MRANEKRFFGFVVMPFQSAPPYEGERFVDPIAWRVGLGFQSAPPYEGEQADHPICRHVAVVSIRAPV